jgi:hypothetical protein
VEAGAEAEAEAEAAKLLAKTIEEDEGEGSTAVVSPVGCLALWSSGTVSRHVCASSNSSNEIARRSPARFWRFWAVSVGGVGRFIHW